MLLEFNVIFILLYAALFFSLDRGCIAAYQGVSYEYAVEMTYPLPEGTSAGLINFSGMVC